MNGFSNINTIFNYQNQFKMMNRITDRSKQVNAFQSAKATKKCKKRKRG